MDEPKARAILGAAIKADGSIRNNNDVLTGYVSWDGKSAMATVDGEYTAEQLAALAWWMNNRTNVTR